MGFRFLPYKKAKKGVQIAGVDYDDSGGGGSYILPPATASTLGGVIIGDGVNVDSNGVISFSGGGGRTLIAEAAANQTYGAQLSYLKTYYNNLTDEQKENAVLFISNAKLYVSSPSVGSFDTSFLNSDGSVDTRSVRMVNSTFRGMHVTSSAVVTYINHDSETTSSTARLYVY